MIADIATVFHWDLAAIEDLDLDEMTRWHGLALARARALARWPG